MPSLKHLLYSILWVLLPLFALAQPADPQLVPKSWHLLDPEQDQVQGISVEKTYLTLLKDQPSRTITVAIIDSGIDIDHEDLKDVLWTNDREIEGNSIDDDKNGYVDDVHGWNFIGGKEGNVNEDTDELTRVYKKLKNEFEGVDEKKISKKQRTAYEDYKKKKEKFEKLATKNKEQYERYLSLYQNISESVDTLKLLLETTELSPEIVGKFETSDPTLLFAKGLVLNIFKNVGATANLEGFLEELKEAVDHFGRIANYGYNESFDPRSIVGDNYNDPYEQGYGNSDVKGPDPMHGTHVAGIIAANRKNELGVKGIADNVKIMSVRAVPNGDERDKDVANAIRYAVDNGAHIINMSFGKSLSPQKEAVDKAVKYAERKGVLLIHAAGNSSDNIDEEKNFPTRFYDGGKEAKNWVEVGASGPGADKNLTADFSNYGKKSVDLFAPGVNIYSTLPGNQYKQLNGTSMASPVTAGVAAVLLSYFPHLSPTEVIDIIRQSTRKFDQLVVTKPGGKGEVPFSELSKTGGILNMYEAVKLAQQAKQNMVVK